MKNNGKKLLLIWIYLLKIVSCQLIEFVLKWSVCVEHFNLMRQINIPQNALKRNLWATTQKFFNGEERYYYILEMKLLVRSILHKHWTLIQISKTAKLQWKILKSHNKWKKKLQKYLKVVTSKKQSKLFKIVLILIHWMLITMPHYYWTFRFVKTNLEKKEKHYILWINVLNIIQSMQKLW